MFEVSVPKKGGTPDMARRITSSLARNVATAATLQTIAQDAALGDEAGAPTREGRVQPGGPKSRARVLRRRHSHLALLPPRRRARRLRLPHHRVAAVSAAKVDPEFRTEVLAMMRADAPAYDPDVADELVEFNLLSRI